MDLLLKVVLRIKSDPVHIIPHNLKCYDKEHSTFQKNIITAGSQLPGRAVCRGTPSMRSISKNIQGVKRRERIKLWG